MSAVTCSYYGTLIHAPRCGELEIKEQALIVVNQPDGKILGVFDRTSILEIEKTLAANNFDINSSVIHLQPDDFIIPGFVDTHNHAPQYAQRGLGQGLHILDWLNQLTFPNEAKFQDVQYAEKVYAKCVDGFLQQGITCASYYASLHGPATKLLATICIEKGQRALVGKCNMNRNAPEYYVEGTAQESLDATEDFILHVRSFVDPMSSLVRPIITPRFAISCDVPLLEGLGQMAAKYDLPIQTHFNEAEQEINATLGLFPEFSNEADLYEHFGLLNSKTILAHCTIMKDTYEFDRLQVHGCGIAHCPIANTTVGGGFMAAPIREFLRRDMKVGLGTDSGGGFSISMLDTMRQALIVSNAREMLTSGRDKALSLNELFYLATLGGAQVCGLGDCIGTIEAGKEFDALVIRGSGVMTMKEDSDSIQTVFEKFLMTGDDRNIVQVYIKGRRIK